MVGDIIWSPLFGWDLEILACDFETEKVPSEMWTPSSVPLVMSYCYPDPNTILLVAQWLERWCASLVAQV